MPGLACLNVYKGYSTYFLQLLFFLINCIFLRSSHISKLDLVHSLQQLLV